MKYYLLLLTSVLASIPLSVFYNPWTFPIVLFVALSGYLGDKLINHFCKAPAVLPEHHLQQQIDDLKTTVSKLELAGIRRQTSLTPGIAGHRINQ